MHEICNFLSVIRENGVEDEGNFFVVENCSKFDTALAGFVIVCFNEQENSLLEFLEDRVSSVKDYVVENFSAGNHKFAMDLIKETLHLATYTEEFINDAGGIQKFLDLYGIGSSNIEFADMTETELPSEQLDFSSLTTVKTSEEPEDVAVASSLLSQMSEETVTKEEETVSKPLPIFSPELLTQEETNALLGTPIEETLQEESQVEAKPIYAAPTKQLVELEPTEPELAKPPEVTMEGHSASIEYEVECNGVGIEGVTFKEGKISVKFEELSKFVNSVMQVADVLEHKDSTSRKTLTIEDLEVAASEVDKYAPSVVKEFLINHVLQAEQDIDLLRVTALLDDFCTYISERNLTRY